MAYTAIYDRLVLSVSEVETWLGITPGSGGTMLTLIIDATKGISDLVVCNQFQDSDGVDLAIPNGVKIGVMQLIKQVWNSKGNSGEVTSGIVSKKKAGDLEIQWSDSDTLINLINGPLFAKQAYNALSFYRQEPGF